MVATHPPAMTPAPIPNLSEPTVRAGGLKFWWPLGLFAVLWLDLIRSLSYTWETREQYSYGWFVPIFAAFLFAKRWPDRPVEGAGQSRWMVPILILTAVIFVPLRVVFEINTDWPLIAYSSTAVVVAVTLYALYLAGGWPWVRHFFFPVAIILLAVAWPYRVDKGLTQYLMQLAAGLTVEILGVFDIPAFQRGNLIEIATGVLGVDEACSGIRSLQSTFMAGFVMGELYRFRIGWRFGLVGVGLVMAFAFNVVRTCLLSGLASRDGIASVDKWHDSAGLSITVTCFLCLWLLAGALQRWAASSGANPTRERSKARETAAGPGPLRVHLMAVGAIALVGILVTELWYRAHEAKVRGGFDWSMAFPTNKTDFRETELPPKTVKLLGHDEGGAASWTESDGSEWSAYFFRWHPRSIEAVMMSRAHRPDVCLPATGLRQVGESRPLEMEVGPLRIPFRAYTYESDSKTFQVFFCQWEDGLGIQRGLGSSTQSGRLQSVFSGRRHVGQQTLEFILSGYTSRQEAEAALRERLPQVIQPAL